MRHEQAAEVKGRGKPKDLSKKAILLSGPPGIGKTSSASIISRCAPLFQLTSIVNLLHSHTHMCVQYGIVNF